MTMRLKKIICAVDFSAGADAVVRYAAAMHCKGSELIMLYVSPEESENGEMLRKHLHEFSRYSDILSRKSARGVFIILHGEPSQEILGYAKEHKPDLIVIGSHGSTAIARLLVGSTAETVMRKATCPVVILKTPENNNNDH